MKIADPAALPADNSGDIAWSPSGQFVPIVYLTSPYITIYDATEELSDAWQLQHVDGPQIYASDFDNRTP